MTAASLSPTQREALARLDSRADELLEFARLLIATPSPNPPGDERAVAAVVVERLRALGVADVDMPGDRPERPNVIANLPGSHGEPSLILSGHLDTKPVGDESAWNRDPFGAEVVNGELHGLGSGDMKAAVAAMVYAAGVLAELGLRGKLQLVFTADEEAGSVHGSQWLAGSGRLHADVAVIGEPCGIVREWEAIDVLSRGAALYKVIVRGDQMHSSISDRLTMVNATVAMARLIDRMSRELKGHLRYEPHPLVPLGPTVNVGVMVKGGVFYGVNPGLAEFACDLRTLPGMTRESVEEDLQAFLELAMHDDPELRAKLCLEIWVPATEMDAGHPVVAALRDAARTVLGEVLPVQGFPGSTDATHFQLTAGVPTVAAFGPGFLPRAHGPNESLAAASVLQAAKIYALGALAYLGSDN